MTLRTKLAWNTTLIVAMILGFTFSGTYLLFKQHILQSFYKRLQSHALTAAFFHLEKDELNTQKYEVIEQKYQAIHQESIRFFDKQNKMVFEYDTLQYQITPQKLNEIRKHKTRYFMINGRQFTGVFYQDNEGDFVVLASDTDHEGQAQLLKLKLYLSLFFIAGLIISFLLTHLLAKQTFKPFAHLIANVNQITAHNLHARLEIHMQEKDELTALKESFNLFLERLENGVNSQRNFLKHASHELKTPLASIISNIEVTLAKERDKQEYKERMQSVHTDALHIKSILESLLLLSGLEASQEIALMPMRIDELLWDLLEKVNIHYPKASLSMDLDQVNDKPHLLEVSANRDLLMIAIGNLVDNALKFSDQQPVSIILSEQQQKLQISIQDRGNGIEQDELGRVFELFYRSPKNQAVPGYGIGLYLSKQIFDLHEIAIVLDSFPSAGTSFHLIFP